MISLLLTELDASIVISINSIETIVCIILLFFISNILQQQENSRFQSQKAVYRYRIYLYPKDKQKRLDLDLVEEGRYYQEVKRLRDRINNFTTKATKTRFIYSKNIGNTKSIDPNVTRLAIQRLAPTLDIILIRPLDLFYLEYSSIVKIVVQLLLNSILTKSAAQEFGSVIRLFVFLPDCPYLLSIVRYLSSYTLTNYGRQGFIAPIVLRYQARARYIRLYFLESILITIGRQIGIVSQLIGKTNPEVLYINIITIYYTRIVGSNRILLVDILSIS